MAKREYIDACYKKKTFIEFWMCAEMAPHNGGHAGVGGKVGDRVALIQMEVWSLTMIFPAA